MWVKIKLELMAIGVLFLIFFVGFGVASAFSMFFVIPVVNWVKFGVLHFPVGFSVLCRFFGFVFSVSMGSAFLMWLANKFDQRNKN